MCYLASPSSNLFPPTIKFSLATTEKLNVPRELIECNSYYIRHFSTVNFFDQSPTSSELGFQ